MARAPDLLPEHVRERMRAFAADLVLGAVVGAAQVSECWLAWQLDGGRVEDGDVE